MRNTLHLAVLLAGIANAAPAGDWTISIPYQDPNAIEAGEMIYGKFCAACHGLNLEGEPNWRTRREDGFLPAPPHDEIGHTWHHTDTQLFLVVKHGVETLVGGDYQSRMNGFGHLLDDQEILQVLAYIKSTWPGRVIRIHNDINLDQPTTAE